MGLLPTLDHRKQRWGVVGGCCAHAMPCVLLLTAHPWVLGQLSSLWQLHGATEPFSCCSTGDALKFLGCHLCYANPPI